MAALQKGGWTVDIFWNCRVHQWIQPAGKYCKGLFINKARDDSEDLSAKKGECTIEGSSYGAGVSSHKLDFWMRGDWNPCQEMSARVPEIWAGEVSFNWASKSWQPCPNVTRTKQEYHRLGSSEYTDVNLPTYLLTQTLLICYDCDLYHHLHSYSWWPSCIPYDFFFKS